MTKLICLCLCTAVALALGAPTAIADEVDVIIIGAGWSGMGAADYLARNKFSNFLVLEATNRTGGRTEAIKFGDPSVGQFMFEVGSNWIDGNPKKGGRSHDYQPIYKEAMRLKKAGEVFNITLIPGGTQNMSNYWRVYDHNGKRSDVDGTIRRRANKATACITGIHNKDQSVRDALTWCGWEPKTEAEWAVDWGFNVDDPGILAKNQLLDDQLPDPTYTWWGADDMFVVDQNPRGFAHLLDTMTASVPPSDPRLKFNTIVNQIDYSNPTIKVTSADGRVFTAKHVICTLPLGVVHHNYASLFVPPLPHKQVHALTDGAVVMSNLTKIFIQWAEPFWDNTAARWLQGNPNDEYGVFPEWHNMNHPLHVPGSNTLFIWLGMPQSSYWETRSDKEIIAAIMKNLKQRYPGKTLVDPVAFHITRHSIDPFRYGSYSGSTLDVDNEWEQIKRPLKVDGDTRVTFGGEHACGCCNGFTHGAYIKGREVAAEYLGHSIDRICG